MRVVAHCGVQPEGTVGDEEESTLVRPICREGGPSSGVVVSRATLDDGRQRLEILGQLTGGVVHDLNNVLSVVAACAAEVREQLPKEHPCMEMLDEILSASAHGAGMTRELLNVARQRPSAQTASVSINQLVTDASRLLKRLVGGVVLSTDLDPALDDLRLPRDRWMSVLMNLAINAIQAMPDGGRLHIRTVQEPSESGVRGRLYVEDTGGGFGPEVAAQIFTPLFTTKPDGTGLGLAVVKRIVDETGAAISVKSRPGQGTVFRISFGV